MILLVDNIFPDLHIHDDVVRNKSEDIYKQVNDETSESCMNIVRTNKVQKSIHISYLIS